MKTYWMITGLVLTGFALPTLSHGQQPAPPAFEKSNESTGSAEETDPFDPDVNAPKLVQVQVEFVEMPHEALTKLLFLAKPKSADATELRKQVQEMVAKKEAWVIETQIVIARSGQKATSESIHEFTFPTEYEQPQPTSSENTKSELNWNYGPVPMAFETRNLGSTLEIEPTVDDEARLVDLRLVPELVWHTGNVTWHEGKDKLGNPFKVQMPDIYSMRLNTAFTCLSGQYTLAGVVSPKDDKGDTDMTRKVMVFVKCDIVAVK